MVAMVWALVYVLQESQYRDITWTITSDSKVTLGVVHRQHGYQPNEELAAFLSILAQEVQQRCQVDFRYTKSHHEDGWNHLADNIAKANL
eukprot:3519606-Pyramimonas_sp.AAC.1